MKKLLILFFLIFISNKYAGYAQTPSDDGESYYKIAMQYASVDNVDYSKVAKYMLKAAEAGHVEGQYKYAMMCLEVGRQADEKGDKKTSEWCLNEFKKWITKAAAQGHKDALEWIDFMDSVKSK